MEAIIPRVTLTVYMVLFSQDTADISFRKEVSEECGTGKIILNFDLRTKCLNIVKNLIFLMLLGGKGCHI